MSDTGYAPGLLLPEPCPSARHGISSRGFWKDVPVTDYDDECQTCLTRKVIRGDHDHLHLNGEECTVPGLNGEPGSFVKCKCGGYHH